MNSLGSRFSATRLAWLVAPLATLNVGVMGQGAATPADFEPAVHQVGETLRGEHTSYSCAFEDGRVVFTPALGTRAPKPYPLAWSLHSIERDGVAVLRPSSLRTMRPSREGSTAVYRHHDRLTERYEVRADGVEQTFTFAERPEGSGDLVVRLAVTTEMSAPVGRRFETLEFDANGSGGVAVGAVTGVGADGARSPGHMHFDGRFLDLVLPAAFVDAAEYPMVLDPLFGTRVAVATGTIDHGNPDVAVALVSEYLAVFERRISASRVDILGQVFTSAGPRRTVFLDTAGASNTRPSVGYVRKLDRFLVTWQRWRGGTSYDIHYRTVTRGGALSGIRRLVGVSGAEPRPEVCGNFETGTAASSDRAIITWRRGTSGFATWLRVPTSPASSPTAIATRALGSTASAIGISKFARTDGKVAVAWKTTTGIMVQLWTMGALFASRACSRPLANPTEAAPNLDGDGTEFFVAYETGTTSFNRWDAWAVSAGGSSSSCVLTRGAGHVSSTNIGTMQCAVARVGPRFVVALGWQGTTGSRLELRQYPLRSVRACPGQVVIGSTSGTVYSEPALAPGAFNDGVMACFQQQAQGRDSIFGQGFRAADVDLIVNSQNPSTGVSVTVSLVDNNGQSSGAAPFRRSYCDWAQVTLTAPALAGVNPFYRWLVDGQPVLTRHIRVTMDRQHVVTAEYRVRVVGSYRTIGTGCPGAGQVVPVHAGSGVPEIGRQLSWDLTSAPSSTAFALFYGNQSQAFDLGLLGMPGCTWYVANPLVVSGTTNASGQASFSTLLARESSWIGISLFTQFAVLDPGAPTPFKATWTNGLETRIGGVR